MNFPNDGSTQIISSLAIVNKNENPIITSNSLASSLNTKQDILTASTVLLGNGGSISAINYNNITTNKPTNFQCDYNSTLINKPSNFQCDYNSTLINKPSNFQCDYNSTLINKPSTFPADMTNIYNKTETNSLLNGKQNTLISTCNILGIGSLITSLDWNNISLNKPSIFPAVMTDIYTKTEVIGLSTLTNYYTKTQDDALLNAKQANLTFSSPLVNTTNTITFNESVITTLTNFYNKTSSDALLNSKQATLTFSSPLVNTTNTITFNESVITTLTNFYNKTTSDGKYALITSLTGKENTLTFNAPLTRTTNTIGIDLSSYSTTIQATALYQPKINTYTISPAGTATFNSGTSTLSFDLSAYQTSASLATTYLKLDGSSDMSGKLTVLNNNLLSSVGVGTYGSQGTRLILYKGDVAAYPYALGIDSATMWYSVPPINSHKFFIGATNTMTINNNGLTVNGNVGIGTATARVALDVQDKIYIGGSVNVNTPQLGNYGGTGDRLILWSGSSTAHPFSLGIWNSTMWYSVPSGSFHSFYVGGAEILRFDTSGNVGIGTNAAAQSLDIYSDNTSKNQYIRVRANTAREAGIKLDRSGVSWDITNKGAGFTTSVNNLCFGSSSVSSVLELTQSGNVGIGTINPNASLELYSTTQLQPRLILSGQEFYTNTAIQSGGIALLCGVNRSGNRQLWITDSTTLTQNTTSPVLRIFTQGIDCVATNGTSVLPISFGNSGATTTINGSSISLSGGNVNINNALTVGSSVNINNNGVLNFDNQINNFRINLWGGVYGFGINDSTLRYNTSGNHTFFNNGTQVLKIDAGGNLGSLGFGNFWGILNKNFSQPLISSTTNWLVGNPSTYTIYNKKYSYCCFYVTCGTTFGIYLGFNIVVGQPYTVTLYYNGGITNYIPYSTAQYADSTTLWIYNASSGIQISVMEYWFN